MSKGFGIRPGEFREQQKKFYSDVVGTQIDANARPKSGSSIQGIKLQVLKAYRENGLIAAKRLFKQLNNLEYTDELFDEWIAECNFKNVVQEGYRRKGREYARDIFDSMNKSKFKGKFSTSSFNTWISKVDKTKGNDGR